MILLLWWKHLLQALCCVLHTFLQETSQHMWLVVVRDQPIICATGKILSPPSLENLFWHHANNSSSGKYTVIVSPKSCSEKSKSNHLCDTDSVTPLPLQSKLKSSCNGQMSLPWISFFDTFEYTCYWLSLPWLYSR